MRSKTGHELRWVPAGRCRHRVAAAPARDAGSSGHSHYVVKEPWRLQWRPQCGCAWARRDGGAAAAAKVLLRCRGSGRSPRVGSRGCLDTMAATTSSNHRQPCPALLMWPLGARAYVSEWQHIEGRPLSAYTERTARLLCTVTARLGRPHGDLVAVAAHVLHDVSRIRRQRDSGARGLGAAAARLGRADRKLVALAAHVLHEDGDVQRAAPADDELVGRLARLHAQRQVALQLALQPLLRRVGYEENVSVVAREQQARTARCRLNRGSAPPGTTLRS